MSECVLMPSRVCQRMLEYSLPLVQNLLTLLPWMSHAHLSRDKDSIASRRVSLKPLMSALVFHTSV